MLTRWCTVRQVVADLAGVSALGLGHDASAEWACAVHEIREAQAEATSAASPIEDQHALSEGDGALVTIAATSGSGYRLNARR